ncbi:MAG TPA: polyprenyl synthetase family protein [Kofleriaceae bacterium]|nr:polyprenyl synthetase family protein [Kofleriaceae bacterium]
MTRRVGSPPLPPALALVERAFAGTSSLDAAVPPALWRDALVGPAGEFLARPGKALRATIVRAGWQLGGGRGEPPDRLAAVLELLHAGSLIVDDVEDGAVERRGGPALHHLVGVPLAINTGSWMYFVALAELAELEPRALPLAVRMLVRCHQGQALDLAVCVTVHERACVPGVVATVTRLKTGALCRLAAELGAIAADADEPTRAVIGEFAELVGCGLQMLDDLGALTSPARREKAYEDLRAGRPTWPWAWLAETGPWDRCLAIAELDELADELATATQELGRQRIRRTLDAALAGLHAWFGASPIVDGIAAGLARMEASYG